MEITMLQQFTSIEDALISLFGSGAKIVIGFPAGVSTKHTGLR